MEFGRPEEYRPQYPVYRRESYEASEVSLWSPSTDSDRRPASRSDAARWSESEVDDGHDAVTADNDHPDAEDKAPDAEPDGGELAEPDEVGEHPAPDAEVAATADTLERQDDDDIDLDLTEGNSVATGEGWGLSEPERVRPPLADLRDAMSTAADEDLPRVTSPWSDVRTEPAAEWVAVDASSANSPARELDEDLRDAFGGRFVTREPHGPTAEVVDASRPGFGDESSNDAALALREQEPADGPSEDAADALRAESGDMSSEESAFVAREHAPTMELADKPREGSVDESGGEFAFPLRGRPTDGWAGGLAHESVDGAGGASSEDWASRMREQRADAPPSELVRPRHEDVADATSEAPAFASLDEFDDAAGGKSAFTSRDASGDGPAEEPVFSSPEDPTEETAHTLADEADESAREGSVDRVREAHADRLTESNDVAKPAVPSDALPEIADLDRLADVPRPRQSVEDPVLAEARDRASEALEHAAYMRWEIEDRIREVARLIDRVRLVDQVRSRPDLIEELDHLDLSDPNACLDALAIVLAEAFDLPLALRLDNFDEWLEALKEQAGEEPQEVTVAPGVDGKIDGRVSAGAAAAQGVEVRDSVGVTVGAHNQIDVTHVCEVERPVIEIADLIEMGPDGPVFNLTAWEFNPTTSASASLSEGYWTNIFNCRGIQLGDHNSMYLTYTYKVASCRVDLSALLQDARVRADLVACRSDSPEEAEAATGRLPGSVARAVDAIDLSRLVSEEEIAAAAAAAQRPRVDQRRGSIVVTHGVGVAVGADARISSTRRTSVAGFRIK